ncbi:TetR/AcrR family transcriptional regulator [Methylovirgula sp. HY1]|uniref:TetR/AcrR family transcriptional regulator n=1 Tax=Methylovirgula sp. HY1 TaxID=2822761 RepID=UPI001C5AAAEA|nr:TetR/AcrR family transcriptional regulator [Methylovirgula sp. HY1]QXX76066.1 putative HTH-type transcriptional regulator YxaF [Methylovirgula sp. HY1]
MTLKFHKTMTGRDKLLEAAQRIMQIKGFMATTVDEICDAAGLTKGAFFHHFKSKEDLGSAVVERFWSGLANALQSPTATDPDPLERVCHVADMIAALSKSPPLSDGCLLGSFVQELSESHPALHSLRARYFSDWADAIERDLSEAATGRDMKTGADAKELAEHFIALVEGGLILAKTHHEASTVSRSMEHFKRYLRSLYGSDL